MIACLGWGSLIWETGVLEKVGPWKKDGPKISVEYLRKSKDGRLTLVIDPDVPSSPALWVEMKTEDLGAAKENLRVREGNTYAKYIGYWSKGDPDPKDILELGKWAEKNGADAVIWTALPAKYNGKDSVKPTMEEAVAYIASLEGSVKKLAEEYICKTPQQVRTPFRNEFERRFQLHPIPSDAA